MRLASYGFGLVYKDVMSWFLITCFGIRTIQTYTRSTFGIGIYENIINYDDIDCLTNVSEPVLYAMYKT